MTALRKIERLLLPAMAVIGILWLMQDACSTPISSKRTDDEVREGFYGGRVRGRAGGIVTLSELPLLIESTVVGLYDDRDSLIFSGTPAEMEAYLRATEDSLEQMPASGGLLP